MADIRKFTFPEALWAGTDHSLAVAMDAHDAMMAGLFDQTAVQTAAAETIAEAPWNFSMQGDVGVVTIKGPLVNSDSWLNQYRGVISYNDVRKAMIYAANNSQVKAILLDIDSGGGAVSGVADAGNLISTIDKGVKPVYAFSDGQMQSAAYWLGSSARAVYASATSTLGSIGVISTHKEYSKMLKDAGIGVTVMRAGEFKALAGQFEPLSPKAQEIIQVQLDGAYKVFAEHVSSQLGVSMDRFEKTMGQGRDFFGEAAVTAGLAQGVKTFDSMVALINKKIDSSVKREQTAGNPSQGNSMTRQALTQAQIDAAAAGIDLQTELTPEQKAAADKAAADKVAADAAAAATAAAAAAAQTANPQAEGNALVTYLQGRVKELEASAVTTGIELAGAKAKIGSMESTHGALVKIAAGVVSTMKVGLGQAKADFSAMAPELLVAEHAATTKLFAETFKVGGVSGVNTDAERKPTTEVSADHLARIAATQFPSTK